MIHNTDIVTGTKYLIKLKWWIHRSSNFFRSWTAKLLIISFCVLSCSISSCRANWTEFSAILKQQQNDNTSRLVSRQKRGLERGQSQNNCPLFVWQNPGNFMQSVIKSTNRTYLHPKMMNRCYSSFGCKRSSTDRTIKTWITLVSHHIHSPHENMGSLVKIPYVVMQKSH